MVKKDPSLEAIFQTPGLFVGLLDEEGNLLDANQAALDFIDHKLEDLTGKKFWNTAWWSHSENLQERLKEGVEKAKNGEMVRFEADHVSPEGKRVTVDFILRPIESKHDLDRLLALGRNITERKEAERKLKKSEERLELALEGTNTGLWDWNVRTGEVVFNERWAKIVGYTLEELQPVSIQTWRELAHPEDLEKSDKLLDKHFDGETDFRDGLLQLRGSNEAQVRRLGLDTRPGASSGVGRGRGTCTYGRDPPRYNGEKRSRASIAGRKG